MNIFNHSHQAGKWSYSLALMRHRWEMGFETTMCTPRIVWFADIQRSIDPAYKNDYSVETIVKKNRDGTYEVLSSRILPKT